MLGALTGRFEDGHTNGTVTHEPVALVVDPNADLKSRVHRACIAKLGAALYSIESTQELKKRVRDAVAEELALDRTPLSRVERVRVQQEIADDILGYGPLEPLLRDPTITDIMVNGPTSVYVERDGQLERPTSASATTRTWSRSSSGSSGRVGRRVDEASPMVDARLPDGSRVNAIIPPLALDGPSLSIRRFAARPVQADDLVGFGSLTPSDGRLPRGVRRAASEHPDLRRHRHRQDDAPERAVGLHPRRRADRDDRGRGRAAAPAAARRPRWRPARRTSRARARSRSATWSATPCGCGPTGSSSASAAAPRRSTCSRR